MVVESIHTELVVNSLRATRNETLSSELSGSNREFRLADFALMSCAREFLEVNSVFIHSCTKSCL